MSAMLRSHTLTGSVPCTAAATHITACIATPNTTPTHPLPAALAHGLSASTHLISIDLGGNPMGPGVAGDLAAALTQQQNQRVLR